MGSLSDYFYDIIFVWPVSSLLFTLVLWFQVNIFLGEYQILNLQSSYTECITKKNIHKILLAPLCHSNFIQAIFNLLLIWDLRVVEAEYGSLFFLLYSFILLLFENIFFFYSINALHSRSLDVQILSSPNYSYNGPILAWLGFLSIDLIRHRKIVDLYLLSFIPIPISISPIIVWLLFQIWYGFHQQQITINEIYYLLHICIICAMFFFFYYPLCKYIQCVHI